MSANNRVVEPSSKIRSLIARKKTTIPEVKSLRKTPVVPPNSKIKKESIGNEENIASKVTEKSEVKTPILKKRLVLGSMKNSAIAQLKKEEIEVKAKPFKKKVGFYVKKSNKKLTVPVAPKLGRENRKSFLLNQKSSFIGAKESKAAKVIKEVSQEKIADCKKSVKSVCSENASTMSSKSAMSKKRKSNVRMPPKMCKIHNSKKIGAGNDNFLTSFISHRNKDKKKIICEKSRLYGFNIDEPWFQQILGMSIDSELDEGECWAVIRKYAPTILMNTQKGIGTIGNQQESHEISSIIAPEINDFENEEKFQFKEKEKSLPPDSDEENDKENQINNVEKWRRQGLEEMINDIKEELYKKEKALKHIDSEEEIKASLLCIQDIDSIMPESREIVSGEVQMMN
ncbi:unnamed protein product [Moneuplotes crassus]|uniref:Uncharacterized protein n=1 Tax=Euplotes crassus TaxID=5936 RepID=A0AAD1UJD6_EUPCR|nr:unnamed protein product [Moneuplotes crassus]